jgi:large subunit ribosomal protein L17
LALFRNLVTDLLRHEKIITTGAKAKEVRGLAERVITMGKRGDLPSRRRAMGFIYDKKVVEKVFDDLGPRYASRPGGYSRIVKLGPRLGDGARMAQLELVEEA